MHAAALPRLFATEFSHFAKPLSEVMNPPSSPPNGVCAMANPTTSMAANPLINASLLTMCLTSREPAARPECRSAFLAPRPGYSLPSRNVNSETTKCTEKRRDPDVIPPDRPRPSRAMGDGYWRGDCYRTRPAASTPRLGVQLTSDGFTRSLPTFQLTLILALVKESITMKLLPSAHPGPRLAVVAILGVL